MTIHIGIDATPLPPRPVGAGVYIIQLIRALAAVAEEGEFRFSVLAAPAQRALIEEQPLPGLNWIVTPDMPPARRLLWEQTSLPGLARRTGFDLLHSLHYTRPLRLGCASVVTIHDMTFFLYPELHTRVKRRFFPWMVRYSATHSQALGAVSESTRRDAMRILHIPAERIFTTPLGLAPAFRPIADAQALEERRRRYDLPENFILFVGLVEPRKNLPLLLRAYAALRHLPELPRLVIVGRLGWGYEEVLSLVDSLDLRQAVRFAGYIPDEDLPMVYNLAQMFVYPSIYEGFGFPPLEAMACGTPVITTGVSAMLDNVGQAGLLTPPQDQPALEQAILRLLHEPRLRDRLSQAGRERAAEFTWARTARLTLHTYRYALSAQ